MLMYKQLKFKSRIKGLNLQQLPTQNIWIIFTSLSFQLYITHSSFKTGETKTECLTYKI